LSLLGGIEGAAVVRFSEKDVVRHALVTRIVAAYNAAGQGANANRTRKHAARKDEGKGEG
jgi:phosphate starvation-inducible protein PhoH and related proteins